MASPSRSGSVATYRASAFSAAFFSSSSTLRFAGDTTYFGLNPFLGSTPNCDLGRSRTWPIEALTMYFEFKYFWIVLTFVGDSTTTRDRFATKPSPICCNPAPGSDTGGRLATAAPPAAGPTPRFRVKPAQRPHGRGEVQKRQ